MLHIVINSDSGFHKLILSLFNNELISSPLVQPTDLTILGFVSGP